MRISYANIPAPASKTTLTNTSTAAEISSARQKTRQAEDRYQQSPSQKVIDAEFVEFYSPSINLFAKELSSLDATLEPDEQNLSSTSATSPSEGSAISKYQTTNYEALPPGSFLDTYA